jgi:hypothetical protein
MDVSDDHLRQLVIQGLSQREIVRRTNIPRTTLQRRLHRLGLTTEPMTPVQRIDTGADHDTAALPQGESGPVESLDLTERCISSLSFPR